MAILHMETDNVHAMASQLTRASDLIREEMQSVFQSAAGADWTGPSRDQFSNLITQLVQAMAQQVEAARVLAQRVESETQEWEQMCSSLGVGTTFHFDPDLLRSLRPNVIYPVGSAAAVTAAIGGQVLGVTTDVSQSDTLSTYRLGNGSYAERISAQVNAQYASELESLNNDLNHYKTSKENFEKLKQSDLALLKETEDKLYDIDHQDGLNPVDFVQDSFEKMAGTRATYEEIRQSTLARIAGNEQRIAELNGKIIATEGEIQSIATQRDAAINSAMQSPNKTYPVLPANSDPIPQAGWCMKYVSDFRGQPPTPGGIERSGSAADLVTNPKYADMRYNIPPETSDLRDQVVPGTVVAYDRGQQGADSTHGHAAVVTEVGKDYVMVKESSWGDDVGVLRRIPLNKLSELTLIGYDSIPRN